MAGNTAPWAGTPIERFEYAVRNGLEGISERFEVLTSFLVYTAQGEHYVTSLGTFEGEDPFTVDLAFEKEHRKLLFEVFLEKQVYKDRASTLVVRFDRKANEFTYQYVNDFGGETEPVTSVELRDLAKELNSK